MAHGVGAMAALVYLESERERYLAVIVAVRFNQHANYEDSVGLTAVNRDKL